MSDATLYRVERFAPSRCPRCRTPFAQPADFSLYAPGEGKSFVEALADARARFPEMYAGGSPTDFVSCARCQNVTLRLHQGTDTFRSHEEADAFVRELGSGIIVPGRILGDPEVALSSARQFERHQGDERK